VDQSLVASCPNAIVKVRLAQQTQTCLQLFGWSLDAHVSCNNVGQGWCLVSTDEGTPGSVPDANELLQVKLDGSGTTRLANFRASGAPAHRSSHGVPLRCELEHYHRSQWRPCPRSRRL
jgi:hypothetical protein